MKAIITVVGKDKSGIVASVATKVAELGLNIDDISQTVLDEFFTMMAVVSSEDKQDFTHLRAELEAFGESLNVKINIQSSAIFDAMHNL
ncbi:ACT domain-containing protein [Streptococcus salivarius]|jgi:ACT domain-containing protein|uniref:ACT domain-containing protein n=1 Tax=Streptococcus salivarius TaxID=1304 RepID=UPI000E485359|nr:ACT domain-containing protein [Streptococcus salivarius]MCY7054772.1 ACT domain-containing protein [Streptococcus salivarius]RGS18443.1 ACT domain-containing protein [Streptococcus salivarius]